MSDHELTMDLTPSARQETIVEEACARFESAWEAVGPTDPAPGIEEFLSGTETVDRAVLLRRLVLLDVNHRRRRGGRPTASEYEARFPELCGQLFGSDDAPAEGPSTAPAEEPGTPNSTEGTDDTPGAGSTVLLPSFRPQLRSERYVVRGFHARGGVGEIYKAEDAEIGRTVALKCLRPNKTEHKDRFRVEAQVTGQLEHPGIVPVHDLGVDEQGRPFYIMSFVHGRTLSDAIAEHHADNPHAGESREVREARLLEIFVKICEAVAYAHHRGVLHRDLKPANVMLGPFGEVLVLDWGMAKVQGQPESARWGQPVHLTGSGGSTETESGAYLGSPAYMSPEVAEGRANDADEQTDVYLLGATLYHLLTGKPPRQGRDHQEMIELAKSVPPLPPRRLGADVPKALEAICLKAMAHRKESRYGHVRDLIQDMERYLAGAPVSVYREPPLVRVGRWCKRHRRGLARSLSAVVLLTMLGTGAALMYRVDLLSRRERAQTDLAAFRRLAEERQFLAAATTPAGQSAVYYDAQRGREAGEQAVELADRLDRELAKLSMPDDRKNLNTELHDLLLVMAAQERLQPDLDRDKVPKLLDSLERAVSLPGQGPSRAYYRLRARCHRFLGEETKAAEEERQAEATSPTALDHFLLAEEYRASAVDPAQTSGNNQAWQPNRDLLLKAVAEYQEALRLQPDHFWCRWQMGRCYLSLKQGADAVAALNSCVALRPKQPWVYSARGLARGLMLEYDQAEADLEIALKIDSKFRPALLHRGIMAWLQRKDNQALADFASVLEEPADRRLIEAAYYRGQLHLQRNEIDKALNYLDMVVKENPDFRPVYLTRAQARFRDSEPKRCLADLTTFLNLGRPKPFGPNDPVLWEQRGRLLHAFAPQWGLLGDEVQAALVLARDDMLEAIRKGDRSAELFEELGSVWLALGNPNATMGAYGQCLATKPPAKLASKVHTMRGWLYVMGFGDPPHQERAHKDFAEAVRLDPTHADAHAGLGFLAALERAPSEAKGRAAQALWHADQNYAVLHNVACIYAELSKVETAQAQQDKDMSMDLLRLAVTLCRQGGNGNNEIAAIKGDATLNVLSDRQDYQDLIK
jgi:serine/threonine protein kinase/tetratricopeptide (TPR) repeat protein